MELLKKRTRKDADPDEKLAEIGLTVADVFTIPLVTDCIFNHLEYSDLLSCSLVSQSWNSQARDYLRRQRTSLLKCKIDDPADSLQQLLDHLSDAITLSFRQLFTGVHVWVEGIGGWKFDVEGPNDWQQTTRTQLRKIFKLFPMKHLIVTFEGYRYSDVSVIYFALEFIFQLLHEGQLETLEITGLVLTYSAKFLWARLPIKGSSKLKRVRMGRRDYDLPLETKSLDGDERWDAIAEMFGKERDYKYEQTRKSEYSEALHHLKEWIEKEEGASEGHRAAVQKKIELLTSKLQDLAEFDT